MPRIKELNEDEFSTSRLNEFYRFRANLPWFSQKEVVLERAFALNDVCRYDIQFHGIGFPFSAVCSQTTTARLQLQ